MLENGLPSRPPPRRRAARAAAAFPLAARAAAAFPLAAESGASNGAAAAAAKEQEEEEGLLNMAWRQKDHFRKEVSFGILFHIYSALPLR